MKIKIHPHLKHFIRQVIHSELSSNGSKKDLLWKEILMKEIENKIIEKLELVETQEDLQRETEEQIKIITKDINEDLQRISKVLKQIPLELLKKSKTF